jgi:hypothetical protein
MKTSSIVRRTCGTELISLIIERRGVSISTQPSPATIVAERRRPESRLISPKNCRAPRRKRRGSASSATAAVFGAEPAYVVSVSASAAGATTSTAPSRIE